MEKRKLDGDVLANRLSLAEAKGQRFLASILGPQPADTTDNAAKVQDEDDDLKEEYGHDRLGVGGILPKDIADGSFTRRAPTSNDKLLEQLIGKKKAKAHIAAKQDAARPNAKAQRYGKPLVQKKADSDDEEEEGRAGTFKSKRSKTKDSTPMTVRQVESDNEDEETRAARLEREAQQKEEAGPEIKDVDIEVETELPKSGLIVHEAESAKAAPKRGRAKPTSFLDEILAERSKKKKQKN